MSSALDIQPTFATATEPSFALADPEMTSVPRPTGDIGVEGSADTVMAETSDAEAGDTVMALAGTEPTGDSDDGFPVQSAIIDQDSNAAPVPGAGEPSEIVALADSNSPGAAPADPATARIYSAGTAPLVAAAPVSAAAPKRGNGLLSLFSNNRSNSARKALVPPQPVAQPQTASAELWSAQQAPDAQTPPRPVIATASAASLPGFDRDRALGLNQPDLVEADDPEDAPIQLASAAGLARLAPNGLNVQHDGVEVACLKPALVRVLKQVERHYGKDVVVTSGYRSPSRNKKASGAEHSLHMYCSAADIQIEGVSKWELATYLREMPGRGGVGTYCHTNSVHIDIGPQRDWNWRCRRRK